jgi:outer membrane protein assembly factor BamB
MPILTWGLAGSPLLANGHLIVQPGGASASLVALNPTTSELIWSTTGLPPSHASFVIATIQGEVQLVGYDKSSLGGWNLVTGQRQWTVIPRDPGDFNVPSPLVYNSGLVLVSENNGARAYVPRQDGKTGLELASENKVLSPDSHSPVISGNRLIGIDNGLHCLSLTNDLKSVWRLKDRAFRKHGSLIATAERVMVLTFKEELVLIDTQQAEPVIVSRIRLSEDGNDCWSHPALANGALYLRLGRQICRLNLIQS